MEEVEKDNENEFTGSKVNEKYISILLIFPTFL